MKCWCSTCSPNGASLHLVPKLPFGNGPEFTQRNVIVALVEKIIAALVSQSFNRDDFQKSLDRFYVAIENTAGTLPVFSDKQHFLNTVYERFFQAYSVKVADPLFSTFICLRTTLRRGRFLPAP